METGTDTGDVFADIGAALKPLASVRELSDVLGIPAATLNFWRANGRGPQWVKLGRTVCYPRAGVLAWLKANEVKAVKA